MACLELHSVSVAFGGVKALSDVSLLMAPGQIHGLIGPNGAGKSTCINVLTGFQSVSAGMVSLAGERIDRVPVERLRTMGVSRTFQAGRLFSMLTVRENLAAASIGIGRRRHAALAEADDMLEWVGITALADMKAAALPYTDQRRVAIARALIGRPAFLMLDEPAAGMSADEADDLATLIRRIANDLGTSVLLVEHNISLVLSLCRTITVLDGGTVIAEGSPATIRTDRRVREAYLGTSDLDSVELVTA